MFRDNSLTAYKKYLEYAGPGVNAGVTFNRGMVSALQSFYGTGNTESPDEIKVHESNGEFQPLSKALSLPLYCEKITIRNLENAMLIFNFKENIISRILGIECASKNTSQLCKIAFRSIVPDEFSQCPQVAGPMGFHEYLLDGQDQGAKEAFISFVANADFKQTPIKIVLENCKGTCSVTGLDAAATSRVFENKCDAEKFHFFSAGQKEQQEEERPRLGM